MIDPNATMLAAQRLEAQLRECRAELEAERAKSQELFAGACQYRDRAQQAESERDTARARAEELERLCYSEGHGQHACDLETLAALQAKVARAVAELETCREPRIGAVDRALEVLR